MRKCPKDWNMSLPGTACRRSAAAPADAARRRAGPAGVRGACRLAPGGRSASPRIARHPDSLGGTRVAWRRVFCKHSGIACVLGDPATASRRTVPEPKRQSSEGYSWKQIRPGSEKQRGDSHGLAGTRAARARGGGVLGSARVACYRGVRISARDSNNGSGPPSVMRGAAVAPVRPLGCARLSRPCGRGWAAGRAPDSVPGGKWPFASAGTMRGRGHGKQSISCLVCFQGACRDRRLPGGP